MEAHADDLRAEVADQAGGAELVEAVKTDYTRGRLEPADRAMLDYAIKLTRTPARVTREDVETLRGHGFADAAIHEIAQITALFNYYNRIADGLGIDDEPEWAAQGRRRG